jgi:RNA-directed DNA polymerase
MLPKARTQVKEGPCHRARTPDRQQPIPETGTHTKGAGRISAEYAMSAEACPWMKEPSDPQAENLLEKALDSANMQRAWKQVKRNKGAAGVDGRDIEETMAFLREHWPDIRSRLLEGTYKPYPVLRVEIPKPGGGVRKLGIPTVVDRLIQQAITQVLTPIFDPGFSESSFGFRPGRGAHDAVRQALKFQQEGKQWVVDVDLKQFFDEVDHDILMARLGRKVKDKRLKRLINGYLKAGVFYEGANHPTEKGTPQGGPLSPFLSNVLLDDLDKELERRGCSFCRYADDVNIYVRTSRAGERTMSSITRYLEGKLKLKINKEKSAVARPWKRKFLGFTFRKVYGQMRICIADKSWQRFRSKVIDLLRPGRGRNLERFIREALNPVLQGWVQYFGIGASKQDLRSHDFWVRRHLRCLIWRQWKRPATRFKSLRELGCPKELALIAYSRRGPWWCSGVPALKQHLPPPYFAQKGLLNLSQDMVACEA